jgi:prolyl 4-hydroxylase
LCTAAIEQRIADWVLIPQENMEGLRITRYPRDRKFHTHWDNAHTNGDSAGGAQYATVLMYLSDVPKGGETVSLQRPVVC